MRNRLLVIAIFLLVSLSMGTAVAALEHSRPAGWRMELDAYLADAFPADVPVTIVAYAQAQQPWNFHEAMGTAYRRADNWVWDVEQLPYPVDKLFCVELGSVATPITVPQLVFVAKHSDRLWRVGWLVHVARQTRTDSARLADLAAVGCDLPLAASGD